MHATAPVPAKAQPQGSALYGIYVLALGICLAGNLIIRIGGEAGWFSPLVRTVLAILVTAPLVIAAVMFWRLLRSDLDEMLQRVVLEGVAFAFLVYLPIVALIVNLRAAGTWTPRLDPPEILMAPAILVAIGVAIAVRRYQ